MTPVMQTRIGMTGNCFAACLASILEVPLEVVPEFSDRGFLDELADWLVQFDLFYLQVSPHDDVLQRMFKVGTVFHTIEGISVRGGLHACVGQNGVLIHDPHPGAPEPHLVEVECFGIFCQRNSMRV